jgi:hypothetical protein
MAGAIPHTTTTPVSPASTNKPAMMGDALPRAHLAVRKRLLAIGFGAAFLALCAFIGWKSVIASRPLPNTENYRQRLEWTAANLVAPAGASPDESFRIYAVNVAHTAPFKEPFIGYGIYLGAGTIITASHVVGRWPLLTNLRVLIAGEDLPAKVIKSGEVRQLDLALLSVEETRLPPSLRLRRNPLCEDTPTPGTNVFVITPERAISTKIISPRQIVPQLRVQFGTLTDEVGASGSGVFNADKKCLSGVVSQKVEKFVRRTVNGRRIVERAGFAGYFIPASKIRGFIPANVTF